MTEDFENLVLLFLNRLEVKIDQVITDVGSLKADTRPQGAPYRAGNALWCAGSPVRRA